MQAIMAMANNRCIGKDGKLPWPSIKEDFKWFKEFTLHKHIVVGRTTNNLLPMLPNRTVWVLSRTEKESAGCLISPSESTMYHYTSNINQIPNDAIIIGGRTIYSVFMPQITEFYVTLIDKPYDGDTYMFPFEHLFGKQEVIREFEGAKVIKYYDKK